MPGRSAPGFQVAIDSHRAPDHLATVVLGASGLLPFVRITT
jgi:hypothetical protein